MENVSFRIVTLTNVGTCFLISLCVKHVNLLTKERFAKNLQRKFQVCEKRSLHLIRSRWYKHASLVSNTLPASADKPWD